MGNDVIMSDDGKYIIELIYNKQGLIGYLILDVNIKIIKARRPIYINPERAIECANTYLTRLTPTKTDER